MMEVNTPGHLFLFDFLIFLLYHWSFLFDLCQTPFLSSPLNIEVPPDSYLGSLLSLLQSLFLAESTIHPRHLYIDDITLMYL